MDNCESSFSRERRRARLALVSVLVVASLVISALFQVKFAQAQVPLEAQSELVEKSLRQSRPLELPPESKPPDIRDRRKQTPKEPVAGPKFFIKKIKLTGNTVISDERLMPLVDLGEGMDVNLSMLNAMADKISALYATEGYLLARAFIPKQKIKDGIMEIVIFEGRINKVFVKGNKKLGKKKFEQRMKRVQDAPVLKEQTLERVLLELNELTGVRVRAVLQPGDLPGTSDLVLDVTESRPYTLSFDADNFGSRYTGPDRYGLSMTYANIFTLGDQFAARWTRSEFGQDSYSPFYTIPINSYGTRMKLNYTFLENELGDSLNYLAAGGSVTAYGLEVSHLLHKSQTASFSARTRLDVKHYENEAQGINTSKDNLMNVSLGFEGNLSDSFLGRTFYDLNFEMGLRERDSTRGLVSRTGGHGEIFTTRLRLTRLQSAKILNSYFTLRAQGQLNTDRALSSYLIGIGGVGSARGYPLSAFHGDAGYNVSLEYTVPFPWHVPSGHRNIPDLSQVLSFVSFVERGEIYIRGKQPGEIDQHITGAGGGLKLTLPKIEGKRPAFSFAATYGVPVFNSIAPSDGSHGTIYLNGAIHY